MHRLASRLREISDVRSTSYMLRNLPEIHLYWLGVVKQEFVSTEITQRAKFSPFRFRFPYSSPLLKFIFSCILLSNHMMFLVQFGINKHVLTYSELHSKSCDYLYKCFAVVEITQTAKFSVFYIIFLGATFFKQAIILC